MAAARRLNVSADFSSFHSASGKATILNSRNRRNCKNKLIEETRNKLLQEEKEIARNEKKKKWIRHTFCACLKSEEEEKKKRACVFVMVFQPINWQSCSLTKKKWFDQRSSLSRFWRSIRLDRSSYSSSCHGHSSAIKIFCITTWLGKHVFFIDDLIRVSLFHKLGRELVLYTLWFTFELSNRQHTIMANFNFKFYFFIPLTLLTILSPDPIMAAMCDRVEVPVPYDNLYCKLPREYFIIDF